MEISITKTQNKSVLPGKMLPVHALSAEPDRPDSASDVFSDSQTSPDLPVFLHKVPPHPQDR